MSILAQIQQDLRKPTSDFGYRQGFGDGPLLKHHLEKQYQVDITVRHCQRIFHYLEMSLKYPRPKMAGASAEEQEAFKKKGQYIMSLNIALRSKASDFIPQF